MQVDSRIDNPLPSFRLLLCALLQCVGPAHIFQ
jgi:hypothetical protein